MSHGQNLRDLLEPLGVYRWEGTFQWGELQSQGEALDGVEAELESIQREMNLATAQAEGLDGVLALLGLEREEGALAEDLRQTAAALLRIGGDSFTLAAINDTIRGCGLPARVEETGDPLKVKVVFPETAGIPAGFSAVQDRIEEILPCHLQVEYQFGEEA
ncbi:MAG TPA: YmfQ family protein [Candidatus Evtepia faecavium]|nr:YmfQ family protein [Candidatus Evtepia faecavium]